MENVILVIHLLLALSLIGVVLLQRSEGGGLGMGGGGGGGVMSARGAATALGKVTWGLAILFLSTSITLTIVSARNAADTSVVDRVIDEAPAATETPVIPAPAPIVPETSGGVLVPPTLDMGTTTDTAPADGATATQPAATEPTGTTPDTAPADTAPATDSTTTDTAPATDATTTTDGTTTGDTTAPATNSTAPATSGTN